ncbi:MAG: hypothetical protein OEX02_10845 [Cyclobacteriaceae bacterium]|nr:hypothetical protein [Cyclobacteriaceae bacterium]
MEKDELSAEELASVKTSFFNILSIFLGKEIVKSKYITCLIKWAVQLGFTEEDLRTLDHSLYSTAFDMPNSNQDKLEAVFHLVHMIYLDNIVEDIELELASFYAEQIGLEKAIVAEVFQCIATAPYDGKSTLQVKEEIRDLLRFHKF